MAKHSRNAKNEQSKIKPPPPSRPQYHYFYGSIDETTSAATDSNAEGPLDSVMTNNDQDSLVGESLISTDNEQDDDYNTNLQDYQQLLVSNGNGLLPIKDIGVNKSRKKSSMSTESGKQKSWCNNNDVECGRKYGGSPLLHVCFLVSGMSITLFIAAVIMFPGKDKNSTVPTPIFELKFKMPFPRVDRADYNDPVENFMNKNLFHEDLLYQGQRASRRVFNFPFPTGAFWTNLVMNPTADRGISYPVAVYPYAYAWNDDFIQVSYPAQHRHEETKAIHDYFFPDLTFSCQEGNVQRRITSFDALSVTLNFSTRNEGSWQTYLVQGSPYITIRYDHATPHIRAFTTFTNILCPHDGEGNFNIVTSSNSTQRRRMTNSVCYAAPDQNNATTTNNINSETKLHGVQFILQSSEGTNWIIFTSEPVTLIFDTVARTTVFLLEPFSGVMRLAYIPTKTLDLKENYVDVSTSTGLQRLIYHARVYPVSGKVSFDFKSASSSDSPIVSALKTAPGLTRSESATSIKNAAYKAQVQDSSSSVSSSSRTGTVIFDFTTVNFASTSSSSFEPPLLMLALPHHVEQLSSDVQLDMANFDLVYKCIKGNMKPIHGSTWSYDETLYDIGFDNDSGSSKHVVYNHSVVRDEIIESLVQDIDLALPTMNENIYGFGKQSARLAQLTHIANKLLQSRNETSTNKIDKNSTKEKDENRIDEVITNLRDKSLNILSYSLKQLLAGNTTDQLLYDENLGGIVTSDGLSNSGADFGNGRYNDHHFHYGYILYACAILGRLDDSFVKEYGSRVDTLFYDVAHNSNFDSQSLDGVFFPSARHKSWYDGHSFASGLFPFANGKSQESSSEAVNCYYGAYLWSLVRHGAADCPGNDLTAQTDFVRLLLATEIRGSRSYWHMLPSLNVSKANVLLPVYTQSFSKNYMVGNLGMLDVICSTWFGTQDLYVHMINFMPVTSVTGELFSPYYVAEEYTRVLEPLGEVEMPWRGYVVSDQAILNANDAWEKATELFSPELDSALSKSQVLYWISTRRTFNVTIVELKAAKMTSDKDLRYSSDASTDSLAECNAHPKCFSAGLTGYCCPTVSGLFLDCCG